MQFSSILIYLSIVLMFSERMLQSCLLIKISNTNPPCGLFFLIKIYLDTDNISIFVAIFYFYYSGSSKNNFYFLFEFFLQNHPPSINLSSGCNKNFINVSLNLNNFYYY